MKRTITGILVGLAAATLCFVPILLKERRDEFEKGKHQGEISGRLEVWRFLDKHFANRDAPTSPIRDCLMVKDVDIAVVEKKGVLTIETR